MEPPLPTPLPARGRGNSALLVVLPSPLATSVERRSVVPRPTSARRPRRGCGFRARGCVLDVGIGAGTRIIPGHGPLSDRAGLQAYHDMLVTVRDRIRSAKAEGKTLEQVQQMQPTAEFDAEWGGGFISPERLIESVYQSLP